MEAGNIEELQKDLNRVFSHSVNSGCLVVKVKIIMEKYLSKRVHVPHAIYRGPLDVRNISDFFQIPTYIEVFIWIYRSELYKYEGYWLEVSKSMFDEAMKHQEAVC